jgi:hypothetical protein
MVPLRTVKLIAIFAMGKKFHYMILLFVQGFETTGAVLAFQFCNERRRGK